MSPVEFLQRADKKYALGIILALIGLVPLVEYVKQDESRLSYEIVSNVRVFDVRENVDKLSIMYDSTDLRSRGLMLRLITVRMGNFGNRDIKLTDYDPRYPVGFVIHGGRLLEYPRVVEATNDYLKSAVQINNDTSRVTLVPVIIEKNQYVTLKLLLTERDSESAVIQPIGKIAGVSEIELFDSPPKTAEPFFQSLWSGSLFVHLSRWLIYTVIMFMFTFIVLLLTIVISERKRESIVREFKSQSRIRFNQFDRFIFQEYVDNGGPFITRTTKIIVRCVLYNTSMTNELIDPSTKDFIKTNFDFDFREKKYYRKLVKSGFVTQENGLFEIHEQMSLTFDAFVAFLHRKGLVRIAQTSPLPPQETL